MFVDAFGIQSREGRPYVVPCKAQKPIVVACNALHLIESCKQATALSRRRINLAPNILISSKVGNVKQHLVYSNHVELFLSSVNFVFYFLGKRSI